MGYAPMPDLLDADMGVDTAIAIVIFACTGQPVLLGQTVKARSLNMRMSILLSSSRIEGCLIEKRWIKKEGLIENRNTYGGAI